MNPTSFHSVGNYIFVHSYTGQAMLKFLIVVGLITYLVYKIGGIFFRAGAASQQYRNVPPRRPESRGNANSNQNKRNGTIKGGDYVDYEEVK
ncbi:MAG: hypothetical protein ACKOE5_03115 [Cytophagales bacterium]